MKTKLFLFLILFSSVSLFCSSQNLHPFLQKMIVELKDPKYVSWDTSITEYTLPNGNKAYEIRGGEKSYKQSDDFPLIVEIKKNGEVLILGNLHLSGEHPNDYLRDGRAFFSIAKNPKFVWQKWPENFVCE